MKLAFEPQAFTHGIKCDRVNAVKVGRGGFSFVEFGQCAGVELVVARSCCGE